jgi:hypothetical protein
MKDEMKKGGKMLGWLAESPVFDGVTSFGAAGLMGAMWLWERRMSRQREEQLDQAHGRILGDHVALDQLIGVVKQNAEAMTKLAGVQEELCRRLGAKN